MTDWSYRGGNIQIVTGGGNFTPGEISGTAQGDMIVLSVGVRNGETPTVSGDWTAVGNSPTTSNATVGSNASIGQVFTWRCERGASAPDYQVTRGGAPDVAMWTLAVLTPASGKQIVFHGYTSNTIAAGGATTATTGAITTPQNDCLVYAVVVNGRAANSSAFDATSPATDSGASSNGSTGVMTTEAWFRKGNNNSTSGFDIGMAQAVAVKDTAGSTGTIQATVSAINRPGMLAAVFKQVAASTGNALGSTLTAAGSLGSAGAASGEAASSGSTLSVAASLSTAGTASGAVGALGATLTSAATLSTVGTPTGAADTTGTTLASAGSIVAGTATAAPPKIATFREDFSTLDPAYWTVTEATAGDVTASGGQLLIKAKTSYPKIESVLSYDLDESAVYVKLDNAGANTGVGGREVIFYVHDAADTNGYGMFVTSDGSLVVHKKIASANTYPASVTYNSTTMRYLRIREASSTVYFERSADLSSWTTIHSFASAAFITEVKIRLTAGNWAADETPVVVAAWDSVNADLAASVGTTLTSAGSLVAGTAGGEAETAGATLSAGAEVLAGAASIGGEVNVAGATVTAAATLPTAGTATGEASAGSLVIEAAGTIVPGAATGSLPKLAVLTDTFELLDLGKWEKHNEGTAGDIAVSGGVVNLKATGDYSILRTAGSYDLTDSAFVVQMNPGDITGVAGREVSIEVFAASNQRYGLAFLSTGDLYIYRYESGSQTFQASATYNPTSMNWLRIRESGGTVYWDRSPNGVTWTNMTTRTAAFSLANVKVDMSAGNYNGAETPVRVATFDNVGFVPGLANGATLAAAATLVAGTVAGSGTPSGQNFYVYAHLVSGGGPSVDVGGTPLPGYSYIVDSSGAYLIDGAEAFLVEPTVSVSASGKTFTSAVSLVAGNTIVVQPGYTYLIDALGNFLVDTAGSGLIEPIISLDGTATGKLLTAAATLSAGIPTIVGQYTYLIDANGNLLVDTSGGFLIEPGPGVVSGATVASAAALVAGAASAGASLTGGVLTAPATIVAGSASVGAAASASGATVTAIGSVISGIAAGGSESNATGTLLIGQGFLIRGAASGEAETTGTTLTAAGSVVAGTAGVGAAGSASGATLVAAGSIVTGAPTSEVVVEGVVLPSGWSVIEGGVTAEANLDGQVFTSGTSIVAGRAGGYRRQANAAIQLTGI